MVARAPLAGVAGIAQSGDKAGVREQAHGPDLSGVDDDGVVGLTAADEGDHAVVAGRGVLHGALVAGDRHRLALAHAQRMTAGYDRNSPYPVSASSRTSTLPPEPHHRQATSSTTSDSTSSSSTVSSPPRE